MAKKQQAAENYPTPPWYVYIARCSDNSYYTGITTDLARRLREHNSPRGGAKYTRSRQPISLVYSEPAASRSEATRREIEIKGLSAGAKKVLVGNCFNSSYSE